MVKRILLALCLCVGSASAEPKLELPPSVVPEALLEAKEVRTATLPKLLQEKLLAHDEFSQGTDKLPETLHVCRIDLNGDDVPEYIVDSEQSYTGGTAHVIFRRTKSGYESIGYFQGGFTLGARANGYYQICALSSGGGGNYTHYVLRYSKGEYRDHSKRRVNVNEP